MFADRDAVALADQPVQIILGALDRYTAHGDIAPLVLATPRQDDAERLGGNLGVLEKQFVEIAHPVEQEGTRILRLDRAVLRHHWRDFGLGGAVGQRLALGWQRLRRRHGCGSGAFKHGPQPSKSADAMHRLIRANPQTGAISRRSNRTKMFRETFWYDWAKSLER